MKTQTLREIAIADPGATGVFLKHGLDFCCGGSRSLADACAEKGLEVASILNEIGTGAAGSEDLTRFAGQPLGDLIARIETHYHPRLRTDLPELITMAKAVEQKHVEKASCPRGLSALLEEMHPAVLEHLAKEEQILFPRIRAGFGASMKGAIQCMEQEHSDHGESLAKLKNLTGNFRPPSEACIAWRTLYTRLARFSDELMEHIHLENNILFPRALCE